MKPGKPGITKAPLRMAEEEEWERPIGLTREYAICVDDSDDEEEGEGSSGDGRSDDCSLLHQDQEKRIIGVCVSSYFQNNTAMNGHIKGGQIMRASYDDKKCNAQPKTLLAIDCTDGGNNNSMNRMAAVDGSPEMKVSVSPTEPTFSSRSANKDDTQRERQNVAGCGSVTQDMNNDNDIDQMIQIAGEHDLPEIKNITSPAEACSNEENAVKNDNPFASFAFVAGENAFSSSLIGSQKRPRENCMSAKSNDSHQQTSSKKQSISYATSKQRKEAKLNAHPFFSKTGKSNTTITNPGTGLLTQSGLAEAREKERSERKALIAKWHAFADPNAPIEDQRFQLLVAARLHARCQEPVVSKAMERLRKYFVEKDDTTCNIVANCEDQVQLLGSQKSAGASNGGLTVHSLANSNPETDIAPLLSSVLFGNTKAKQIVEASKDILAKFGGRVPESISSLKEITGIGPKLAEILRCVNRRDSYC